MDVLHNVPGAHHLPIAPALQKRSDGASRRLSLINPYLADRAIIRGIRDAGLRGVDVRVIVPADPPLVLGPGRRAPLVPRPPRRRRGRPRVPPAWPTPRSSSPTTPCWPGRRTSMRSASGAIGSSSCGRPTAALADHVAKRAVRSGSPHRNAGANPERPPRTGRQPGGVGDLADPVGPLPPAAGGLFELL